MFYKKLNKIILLIMVVIILIVFQINNKSVYAQTTTLENKPNRVYITFDDGPNEYTSFILDILKEHEVKATFFLLEPKMKNNPELVKRILNEGHAIGLHGENHNLIKTHFFPKTVINEMNKANNTLFEITETTSKIIRIPYGSFPWYLFYRNTIKDKYLLWDWNVDSRDYFKAYLDSTKIGKRIIYKTQQKLKYNERTVVLLHDKPNTLEALP